MDTVGYLESKFDSAVLNLGVQSVGRLWIEVLVVCPLSLSS